MVKIVRGSKDKVSKGVRALDELASEGNSLKYFEELVYMYLDVYSNMGVMRAVFGYYREMGVDTGVVETVDEVTENLSAIDFDMCKMKLDSLAKIEKSIREDNLDDTTLEGMLVDYMWRMCEIVNILNHVDLVKLNKSSEELAVKVNRAEELIKELGIPSRLDK